MKRNRFKAASHCSMRAEDCNKISVFVFRSAIMAQQTTVLPNAVAALKMPLS